MSATDTAAIESLVSVRAWEEKRAIAEGIPVLYQDGYHCDQPALTALLAGKPAFCLGTHDHIYPHRRQPYRLDGGYWLRKPLILPDAEKYYRTGLFTVQALPCSGGNASALIIGF